jgi:hypothetical protein
MGTTSKTVCFTDIKSSSTITQDLGHARYLPLLLDHLRAGKVLAAKNGGRYIKNIGDAHLVVFDAVDNAIAFASQMQEWCSKSLLMQPATITIRIGLSLGHVEETDDDVFGTGVNFASRVEGCADAGLIVCDGAFVHACRSAFGGGFCDQVFSLKEAKLLKGFEDCGEAQIFQINWQTYSASQHGRSIAKMMYDHLDICGVEAKNLSARTLSNSASIIWPVVPRDVVTAIHRGQLEVIRLLCSIGWRVTALIADCGEPEPFTDEYCKAFGEQLIKHASRRGIAFSHVIRMSTLYDHEHQAYGAIQAHFRRIVEKMKVSDLMAINTKSYQEEVKQEVLQRPTLTHLRPPLTLAAVLHLATECPDKCLVVAGRDENIQWQFAYNVPGVRENIGALLIPTLKADKNHQALQHRQWPIWDSQQELESALSDRNTNTAKWVYLLHALLPAFPLDHVEFDGNRCFVSDWAPDDLIPAALTPRLLSDQVWDLLSSAD